MNIMNIMTYALENKNSPAIVLCWSFLYDTYNKTVFINKNVHSTTMGKNKKVF